MTLEEAKQLSPDEINRCISEALGWKETKTTGIIIAWQMPDNRYTSRVPDYFHDLNACNAVERALSLAGEGEKLSPFHAYWTLISQECGVLLNISAPASIRAIALAVVLSERKK